MLNAEVAAASSNWNSVLKVPEGERIRIRFLCNADQGLVIPVHGRYIQEDMEAGYTVPCAKLYKQDGMPRFCPFCDIPNDQHTGTKNFFCWLIWNYNAGMIQAFAFKANKTTPLAWLSEYYEDHKDQQGLLGRDFNIKREGKGFGMQHHMSPQDPTEFRPGVRVNIPRSKAEIDAMILKLCAEAWFPALLRPGELIVPKLKNEAADTSPDAGNPYADNKSNGSSNGQYTDSDLEDANAMLPQEV